MSFKPASLVEVRLPIPWDDSDKCSTAKCSQCLLNTARIWNDMETFAVLNGLNHRLNKHKKLARKDLARGFYKNGDSIFVVQSTAACAKSLDLSSTASEIFL